MGGARPPPRPSGFPWLWRAGAALGMPASHGSGALAMERELWAHKLQKLWYMGLAAPQHVGSSQTRDRTDAPCIARRILNHWTIRETPQV